MRRAVAVALGGTWSLAAANGIVTLSHAERVATPMGAELRTDAGQPFRLDLRRAVVLADGDGLRLDDDTFLLVRAAIEECALIRCAEAQTQWQLAWHLGRRGLPVATDPDGLLLPPNSPGLSLAVLLGASVETRLCAFDPHGQGSPPSFGADTAG
jgi:urease accessory protein